MTEQNRSAKPLSPQQLDSITDVAADMGFRYRLIAEVIPFTGLTFIEFCHLRKDWRRITDPDTDMFIIRVPLASPCAGSLRTKPSGREFESLDKPCHYCRREGEWSPAGDYRHRTIPVAEPLTREVLNLCFDQYGMDSLPFTVSSNFYQWMDELASRAGLSRNFGFVALRRTFGVMLIRKGYSSEDVSKILGLSDRQNTKPLFEAADEPVDWDRTPAQCLSDEELITALQQLAAQLDRQPTSNDIKNHFKYSYRPLFDHFGGLRNALDAAGLEVPTDDHRTIPEGDLLSAIQTLAKDLGHPPTAREMREDGEYSYQAYLRRFGSWDSALETAGFNPEDTQRYECVKIDQQVLISELHRLAEELGRPPTKQDVIKEAQYSRSTYQSRFGGVKEAREVAGLGTPSQNRYSDEDLLKELQRLADELDHMPTSREIDEDGNYSYQTYRRRFGGIDEAHKAAIQFS